MEFYTDLDLQKELRDLASKEGYVRLALRLGYSFGFINSVANGKKGAPRKLINLMGYEVVYRKKG